MNNKFTDELKIIGVDLASHEFDHPITVKVDTYPCPIDSSLHCPFSKLSYENMKMSFTCEIDECNVKNNIIIEKTK